MEFKQTNESEWKGGSRSETEKTASKVSIKTDDVKSDFTLANDKMCADFVGTIDGGDYPMAWGIKTESKQAANSWKVKGAYAVSTPNFSGAEFAQDVSSCRLLNQERYNYKSHSVKAYLYFVQFSSKLNITQRVNGSSAVKPT